MLNGFVRLRTARLLNFFDISVERPFLTASFYWQAIFEMHPECAVSTVTCLEI